VYAWGGDWTSIFSSGFQLTRLVLGPFGIIAGKIPFVALFYFMLWVGAAFTDWVLLSIPYLVLWQSSGLPRDYYDTDLLIGTYLYGDVDAAKDELREIVKNDKPNSEIYQTAL